MRLVLMAVAYSMAWADDRASELLKRVGERYATLAEYDMEYIRTQAADLHAGFPDASAGVRGGGAGGGLARGEQRWRIAAASEGRMRSELLNGDFAWISDGREALRIHRRRNEYTGAPAGRVEAEHAILNTFTHIDEQRGAASAGEEQIKAGGSRLQCVRVRLELDGVQRLLWIEPVTAFVWKYEAGAVVIQFRKIAVTAADDLFMVPPKHRRVEFFAR